MHHCQPKVLSPIVYPTKCCVQNFHDTTIVPHIHPSHTTNVNHHLYQHNHYFPHTESAVNEVANQHFVCPPGAPVPPVAPGTPGVAPAPGVMPGPGFPGNNNMLLG
ncbi:CotD family spore coat protein [Bacillus sp. AK128]